MSEAGINFALQAVDEYSGVFDELESQMDALSGAEIDVGVSVDDAAGPAIEDIQSRMDQLDGMDASLTVSADDQASSVLDEIYGKLDELESKAGSFSDLLTAGFAGGIGGVVAGKGGDLLDQVTSFFTDMPAKAADSESAMKLLEVAVTKQGYQWNSVSGEITKYIDLLSKATAFDDEDVARALARLFQMGMNFDTAMRSVAASLDLAAARQMDVSSSAQMIGRAWQGNYTILERYGIKIDESVKKSGDFMAALDALGKKFGGTAVQMADTMSGEMKRAGNAWENFQEMVGGGINWLGKQIMGGLNWLFGQKTTEMPTAPTLGEKTTFKTGQYTTFQTPEYTTFQTISLQGGGIVSRPTLALIGERGPEAVVPLDRGGGIRTLNLNITVRGATTADLQFAQEVGRQLAKLDALSGGSRGWS